MATMVQDLKNLEKVGVSFIMAHHLGLSLENHRLSDQSSTFD